MGIDPILEFTAFLQGRGLSDGTADQYPQYVRYFHKFIGGGDLLAVDDIALSRYVAHLHKRKLNHTTIRRYFVGIGSFYDFLFFKKRILASPLTKMFRQLYLTTYKDDHLLTSGK